MTEIVSNSKDFYEIIDTALKIGLGALIGGVSSFITLKSNQKHEIVKEKMAYKLKLLNEASNTIDLYLNSSHFLLDSFYGMASKKYIKFSDLPQKDKDKYFKIDSEYLESIKDAHKACSKFNIIGLSEVLELIKKYDLIVVNLKNDIASEGKDIPAPKIIMIKVKEISDIKYDIQILINKYFINL
ncbi:MAG: hypothetical protein MJK08_04065 [Campylobacterales bacterium]|nr:hypothetical protein [Campylobacterales bacterium]